MKNIKTKYITVFFGLMIFNLITIYYLITPQVRNPIAQEIPTEFNHRQQISDDELSKIYGYTIINPQGGTEEIKRLKNMITDVVKLKLLDSDIENAKDKLLNWDMNITRAHYDPNIAPFSLRIVDQHNDLDVSIPMPNHIDLVEGKLYVAGDTSMPLGDLFMTDIRRSGEVVIHINLAPGN